jgi:hypothetical protein
MRRAGHRLSNLISNDFLQRSFFGLGEKPLPFEELVKRFVADVCGTPYRHSIPLAAQSERQNVWRGVLRLFHESMQQYHLVCQDAENHLADLAVRKVTPHFPEAAAQ